LRLFRSNGFPNPTEKEPPKFAAEPPKIPVELPKIPAEPPHFAQEPPHELNKLNGFFLRRFRKNA
jgi:hypothetical protein